MIVNQPCPGVLPPSTIIIHIVNVVLISSHFYLSTHALRIERFVVTSNFTNYSKLLAFVDL